MTVSSSARDTSADGRALGSPLGPRHLLAFLLGTFAITWGAGALYFLAPETVEAWLGDARGVGHPLFRIAVYGPAIAAFAVVAAARGRAGLGAFARRLLHWRVHPGWYAAVLLGLPASLLAARAVALARGAELGPWPDAAWTALLGGALLDLVRDPGPVEEIGWRGLALPLLQQRMSALSASAVLGLVWGVWHLPAFFIGGTPQGDYAFWGFLYGSVVLSLLMTVLYNGTGGSIPLVFLFHYANNDPLGVGKSQVAAPWILGLTALAALAIAWLGPARLGRRKHVTPLRDEPA